MDFRLLRSFAMLRCRPSPEVQDAGSRQSCRVLRPGAVFVAGDSLDGEEFRALHADDVCVPIDPGGLEGRLNRAGFERVVVATNEYALRPPRVGAPAVTGSVAARSVAAIGLLPAMVIARVAARDLAVFASVVGCWSFPETRSTVPGFSRR